MSKKLYATEAERKRAWYEKQKAQAGNTCIECGKAKGLHGVRCQSCQSKVRAQTEGMPRIPKTREQKYCLDCGKEIQYEAKRCQRCGAKERTKLFPPPSQLGRKRKK